MDRKSVNSFVNLCKVFEMRIKLDKEKGIETEKEILDNFEKYSIKIDNSYNADFQKNLKPLIAPAKTIEKEGERLKRLIALLEDRLCKRLELEDKFYAATGYMINGLQLIISDSELNSKKRRLEIITSYLDTKKEIADLKETIDNLKELLLKDDDSLEEYKKKNKTMEDDLYLAFISYLKKSEIDKDFNESTLTEDLSNISEQLQEAKETLDITKESVNALDNEEIDEDYKSYIEEAEQNYNCLKNKELLLRMYILILNIDEDLECLYDKRNKVKSLLEEKKNLNTIEDDCLLEEFENILMEQIKTLEYEKDLLENITNYNTRIDFKETRLDELEDTTKDEDTLEILSEYGLLESYEVTDLTLEEEEKSEVKEVDSNLNEEISIKEPNPNRVIEIKDYPPSFNMGLARLKAENILDEFNKKLNKDKLEAEIAMETNSNDLKTASNEKELSNDEKSPEESTKQDVKENQEVNINSSGKEDILNLNNEEVWQLPSDINTQGNVNLSDHNRKIDLGLELESVKPIDFELNVNDKPENINFNGVQMPKIEESTNTGFFEGPLPTISDLNINGESKTNNLNSLDNFNLGITNSIDVNINQLEQKNESNNVNHASNNLPIWDTKTLNTKDDLLAETDSSSNSEPFWTPVDDNSSSAGTSNGNLKFIDIGNR